MQLMQNTIYFPKTTLTAENFFYGESLSSFNTLRLCKSQNAFLSFKSRPTLIYNCATMHHLKIYLLIETVLKIMI